MRAVISFYPFSLAATALTMENLIGPQNLVLPATTYQDCFSYSETDTSHGRYSVVLAPYKIDPVDAMSDKVAILVYSAAQEGVPTAFLQ